MTKFIVLCQTYITEYPNLSRTIISTKANNSALQNLKDSSSDTGIKPGGRILYQKQRLPPVDAALDKASHKQF